jgi:hypothetical protein
MASFIGLNHRVYFAHLDLSGKANMVNFGDLSCVLQDSTTFNDGGFSCVTPGLRSGAGTIGGFQDYALGVLDDQISIPQLGTSYAVSVIPAATTTVTAGDPVWFSRGVFTDLNPLDGPKGDMGKFELGFGYDTIFTQGLVGHPLAARTTTGTGTAVAKTGPTATQKLYAALHVTAYSGITNAVIKVQSDDNVAFPSATDRITFATVTGLTNEFASVAGAFNTETHLRVSWTITGVGSVSFAVSFAVL